MDAPEPRKSVRGELVVRLADMPEALYALRKEMAQLLREAADDEGPEVVEFAKRVADAFEIGQEV